MMSKGLPVSANPSAGKFGGMAFGAWMDYLMKLYRPSDRQEKPKEGSEAGPGPRLYGPNTIGLQLIDKDPQTK